MIREDILCDFIYFYATETYFMTSCIISDGEKCAIVKDVCSVLGRNVVEVSLYEFCLNCSGMHLLFVDILSGLYFSESGMVEVFYYYCVEICPLYSHLSVWGL